MPKPEYEFHHPQGPWTPVLGPATRVWLWLQVLAIDEARGAYTGLSRYAPGADSTPNGPAVHPYWEEGYILGGDLTDRRLGQTFCAGVYARRPAGMVHGPWRSEASLLMLEFRYSPGQGTAPPEKDRVAR